jgi:ketosteroid isomerase-like protein
MLKVQELLIGTYRAFNARDIDTVLDVMHSDVSWPNAWEGGRVHGHQELRDYWTRQWKAIDPVVEPIGFSINGQGDIVVRVHQVVRDLEGNIIKDGIVEHVFRIKGGLIKSMEIKDL